MSDEEDNNNNINNRGIRPSSQRAVPFGDDGNNINSSEVVDNNNNNTDDNNPTMVPEDNTMPVDEEAGNNVQEGKTPEIIDDDDCPVPFNSALYEDRYDAKGSGKKPDLIDSDDAPLPPAQMSALYEQIVDDNEGTDEKLVKKKLEAENTTNLTHHVADITPSQSSQQQSQRSAPTSSAASSGHQQQSPAIIGKFKNGTNYCTLYQFQYQLSRREYPYAIQIFHSKSYSLQFRTNKLPPNLIQRHKDTKKLTSKRIQSPKCSTHSSKK